MVDMKALGTALAVNQQYLPPEIEGEHFYELSDMGYEKKLKEYMKKIHEEAE